MKSFLKKIEDVVESIKEGYAKGRTHNIIILDEGVMSADALAKLCCW